MDPMPHFSMIYLPQVCLTKSKRRTKMGKEAEVLASFILVPTVLSNVNPPH
jgi:hypothetical protein